MSYSLTIFDADDTPAEQRREAEKRFRRSLESSLGNATLVAQVYTAFQGIVGVYGENPDLDGLTDAERAVVEQWLQAETAAVAAAFGPHRYMGDAMFEIRVL
jgi:hypothetical protein